MTNFKSIIDTQVLNYRRSHFGQQPTKVDYVTFGFRAIISIVTTNENYLYNNNYRNGLHKIKKHFISLQDRTIRKENLANRIHYNRDSFPSAQYILSPDEFTRSINENGELQLNDTVFVSGDLDLSKFPNIKKLPDKFFVDGDLILSGCSELQALSSKELKVSGSLHADNCTSLRQVTKNIRVGGDINFESCANLDQLPKNIIHAGYKSDSTQRRINLKDTAIGPEYSFFNKTCRSSSNLFKRSDSPAYVFEFSNSLDVIIRRFIHASGGSYPLPQLGLLPDEKIILQSWLEKKLNYTNLIAFLAKKKQYTKVVTQQVMGLLQVMGKDPQDKEALMEFMSNDLSPCVDPIDIEIQLLKDRGKRAMVEGNEQRLKDLVKQDKQLNLIQRFAKTNFGGLLSPMNELIAVFELKQGLSKYLDLPLKTHTNENQTYSSINEKDIQTALTYIHDKTQDLDIEEYIEYWEPWILYKSRTYPTYSSLREADPPEEQWCAISHNVEKNMVVYQKHSFGYENFVKHYLMTGKDPFSNPFSNPFSWREVRRYSPKLDNDRQHSIDDVD